MQNHPRSFRAHGIASPGQPPVCIHESHALEQRRLTKVFQIWRLTGLLATVCLRTGRHTELPRQDERGRSHFEGVGN